VVAGDQQLFQSAPGLEAGRSDELAALQAKIAAEFQSAPGLEAGRSVREGLYGG